MFDRFTEKARRVVFFSRYEAGLVDSQTIGTEHLLLGLIREDAELRERLPQESLESIRRQIKDSRPAAGKPVSTSVDLPLSSECVCAFTYAAEESDRLKHRWITEGHIVLGLLRQEECFAARLLTEHGIDLSSYRETVERWAGPEADLAPPPPQPSPSGAMAPSLAPLVNRLARLVDRCAERLDTWGEVEAVQRLKRLPWTRQEALGHLVDWSTTHQRWFARALSGPSLAASFPPQHEWVDAQCYGTFEWQQLVDLWVCLNRLLAHVLSNVPEDKLRTPCKIGIAESVPLQVLIERYVEHSEDVAGQILTHG
ncbi:MAG: hypothetical protein HY858_01990 [Candidatus Solibacter usitatus]|nr:hypothetical protein [Candidatus Solibacter usitatus]